MLRLASISLLALPLAAATDFAASIHPILVRCTPCHSGPAPQAGLLVTSREALLKGGAHGPALVLGQPQNSLMIRRATGNDGQRMPPTGPKLTDAQIAALGQWIAEGAPWTDVSPRPVSSYGPPLKPRDPPLPAGSAANPIDRFIDAYFAEHHLQAPQEVSDALFLRRAALDVQGIAPSLEQSDRFLAHPDRAALVDTLLADNQRYAEHWISFWNDLLRNDQGVNYAGTRKSITPWLLASLKSNLPYDRFARALLDPESANDPDGFLLGVNWRGDVNASQTSFMQAAQNSAQVFLGVNLKCASCHDSFINRYTLRQSYALAAMFSEQPNLELVRCDAKTGVHTGPEFPFPEVSRKPASDSLADRHRAAAESFTAPENGRFTRTVVNRYWQRLFGQGLVANVDDMDAKPWNADLLDWLASDLAKHNYDLKYLIRLIATSRAYSLPAIPAPPLPDPNFTFRGPAIRRITAEEFADSLSAITGEWRVSQTGKEASYAREWELKSTPLTRALGRPIRDQVFTTREEAATTLQALELVNGETLAAALRRGALRLLGQLPHAPVNRFDSGRLGRNSASVPVSVDLTGAKELWLLTEDAGAYDPSRTVSGWHDLNAVDKDGKQTRVSAMTTLAQVKTAPDGTLLTPPGTLILYPIEGLNLVRLEGSVSIDKQSQTDEIMPAVRFFVFTQKPERDRLLPISGKPPAEGLGATADPDALVTKLFREALSRTPSEKERDLALHQVAPQGQMTRAGLEDFLWTLVMHPEFQYIL